MINEQRSDSYTKVQNRDYTKRKLIFVSLFILLLISIYLTVAHTARFWPFQITNEQAANPISTPKIQKAPEPKKNIALIPPSITEQNGVRTLIVKAKVDTKEQGDCTLMLANDEVTISVSNSTKGVKGATGCLNWNIGAEQFTSGKYNITIEFVSESKQISILKDSITIK